MDATQPTSPNEPIASNIHWRDLSQRTQVYVGLLNGLLGFFFCSSLSWNHATWQVGLVAPLISCLTAGLSMAVLMSLVNERWAFAISCSIGFAILIIGRISLSSSVWMTGVGTFCVLFTCGTTLNYAQQRELADACLSNFKRFSLIVVACLCIYLLADTRYPGAKSASVIGFMAYMSIAIIAFQLVLTRHAQAGGGLRNRGLLSTGASVLDLLVELFGMRRFFVRIIALLILISMGVIVLTWILIPLLLPLAMYVLHRLHKSPPVVTHSMATGHAPINASHHQWIVWTLITFVLIGIGIAVMLRYVRKSQAQRGHGTEALIPSLIEREKINDDFLLEQTEDKTRKAYQRFLRDCHKRGVTIGLSESPHELLQRLDGIEITTTAGPLTIEYEQVRYGQQKSHR